MRQQDPRVPLEVEEYLVNINAAAGALGGGFGGAIGAGLVGAAPAGARGGAAGGARGGARGARRLKTVVEEREGSCEGGAEEVLARVGVAFERARALDRGGDLVRLAVPIGRTGLQHIVVDLVLHEPPGSTKAPRTEARIRAYGKEGLLSRKPTAATADGVLAAITA